MYICAVCVCINVHLCPCPNEIAVYILRRAILIPMFPHFVSSVHNSALECLHKQNRSLLFILMMKILLLKKFMTLSLLHT